MDPRNNIMYPGSLSQLATWYNFSDGRVYWGRNEVEGADLDSFVVHSNVWASDRNRVYIEWRPRRVDRASFKYLNPVYIKDKNFVYDYHGAISGADPETFECLDSGLQSTSWEVVNYVWARGYAKDKNYVYYHDQMTGTATPIKSADIHSFMSFGNGYGRDNKAVFYEKLKLNGAAPDKWLHLGKCYSTDQTKTFYMNKELKEVNPGNFRVILTKTSGGFASDGNKYFRNSSEISKQEFIDMINKDLESIIPSHNAFIKYHCK